MPFLKKFYEYLHLPVVSIWIFLHHNVNDLSGKITKSLLVKVIAKFIQWWFDWYRSCNLPISINYLQKRNGGLPSSTTKLSFDMWYLIVKVWCNWIVVRMQRTGLVFFYLWELLLLNSKSLSWLDSTSIKYVSILCQGSLNTHSPEHNFYCFLTHCMNKITATKCPFNILLVPCAAHRKIPFPVSTVHSKCLLYGFPNRGSPFCFNPAN